MAKKAPYKIELAWGAMSDLERALWGTTLALHLQDEDGGIEAADAAVARLRIVTESRSRLPEPEDEAAMAGFHMEYEEFSAWYSVAYRVRHCSPDKCELPTAEQTRAAYERYAWGRCEYY